MRRVNDEMSDYPQGIDPEPNDFAAARDAFEDPRRAVGRAALKAFRFPKGVSGNPKGLDRAYREARKVARGWSPEIMAAMARMALDENEDGRVRAVCGFGVMDRAGLGPIDYREFQEQERSFESKQPPFNPRDYSPEEIDKIEEVFRLIIRRNEELAAAAVGARAANSSGRRIEVEMVPPEGEG